MQCEATLLGRVPVDGAVDAGSLATLIRSLQHGRTEDRRYLLRFNEVLEFIPRRSSKPSLRRHEDEGFESDGDDDTASTRSVGSSADDTTSNSSSCCFVDDHVFKCHPAKGKIATRGLEPGAITTAVSPTSSCMSSVATDSANSSGASDTDDLESSTPSPTTLGASTSVNALVKSLSLFQQRKSTTASASSTSSSSSKPSNGKEESRETYTVDEVAFCHTDPAFTRVVLWVVKKRQLQRLSPSGADTSSGLEAVVFECQREDLLKKLCEGFQEKSRRAKLEKQYRHPHRRKEAPLTPESIIKALKHSTISTDKVGTLSHPPQVTVKPILPDVLASTKGTRFNLVQRTDGDGITHIEVSRGLPVDSNEDIDEEPCGGPSSIISISTPDIGNLLSTSSKSRFCKEIEGVIRSDIDTVSPRRERQRQPAILVVQEDGGEELRKVWTPPVTEVEDPEPEIPPQRPERKRYTRKVKSPAPQPPPLDVASTLRRNNQQMVMRGQFIRVAVNQPQPLPLQNAWLYPSANHGWAPLKKDEDVHCPTHYQKNRNRLTSSRSKSPPARRPMAYRYIDTVPNNTNTLSNRFFGLSQKLREITTSAASLPYSATMTRRRNSLGEIPARFEYLGEGGGKNGNLKSVIKKTGGSGGRRLGEYTEPKKVTFSAYATVQVVD